MIADPHCNLRIHLDFAFFGAPLAANAKSAHFHIQLVKRPGWNPCKETQHSEWHLGWHFPCAAFWNRRRTMGKKTWENPDYLKFLCSVHIKELIICRCPVCRGFLSLRKSYKVWKSGPGKAIHGRTQPILGHLQSWRSWDNGVVMKGWEPEQQKAVVWCPDLLLWEFPCAEESVWVLTCSQDKNELFLIPMLFLNCPFSFWRGESSKNSILVTVRSSNQ